MYKSVVITEKDNVATALENLPSEQAFQIKVGEQESDIILSEPIQFGHKFAIKDIAQGENIIKYGEIIGRASQPIRVGEYVHVHNLEGTRGRGDK